MFEKNNENKNRVDNKKQQIRGKKEEKKLKNSQRVKKRLPIFIIIGLVIFILLVVGIYYLFLNFKEIAILNYEGYAISGKEITETLLGNNEEEDKNKKNLFLTKIYEQDKLYKKVNDYFIGENKKEEINLSYPIYINDNTALYNLSQDIKLITSDFKEIEGYPNLTVSGGIIYNESDLERIDEKEYIFLKNESSIFINLKEIKIQTVANEYVIPVNSNIYFDKEEIRYYEVKKNILRYKEIRDIDTQSKIKIGEKEVGYEELLTLLKLKQIENQNLNTQGMLIEEDTSKESKKKEEVEKENQTLHEEPETIETGVYIKPEVTCSPFKANVYTASTELMIKDPSSKILEPITFIFRRGGRIYLRKTYTSSGSIEVKGLSPNTTYEIEGSYVYENEYGQKIENTFYKDSITTTGNKNLDPIILSFENGEIFSNKIQLKNLQIASELQNEAVKGIKRLEVEIGDVIYKLTGEDLRKFIAGEAIIYETLEGMKSNQKVYYTIKLYDNQGNELRVENNKGETRTSKQVPKVSIRLNKQNVIEVEIGLKLNNRDDVVLENYHYQITKPTGEIVKESGLSENDESIYLNNLDPNQYYTITIYASYDLEDNKGKQESQIIGQTIFATQPLSTLGYLELNTNLADIQTNSGTIEIKINDNRTDKRLIQILQEIKIELVEIGKENQDFGQEKTYQRDLDEEENTVQNNFTEEGNILETIIITGEELQKLKVGETEIHLFENLVSNTKYSLNITSKVQQGETVEEVQVTYSLKEFITLKMPAEVQMINLFVTADLIDFDVRIEDIDHAVLTNKVRMELRDEKTNLLILEEIDTNGDYARKTIEKLELGKTYTLSFYADQYNEGSTDSTYEANYLLKELRIVTETGIKGSLGLTGLTRKGTGKNLVDVRSKVKWYVYPNFNTADYYGKEYNEETKILTLGGHGNNRRAVYDLREYAGQEVTMSFRAKLASDGGSKVYIQNSKQDKNRQEITGLVVDEWKSYAKTLKIDETGYLGFYIQGGNGVEIKELQIELGPKKTNYEEYTFMLESNLVINLTDEREEIKTKDYYIKLYQDGNLIQENRYEEIDENNQVINHIKTYLVEGNHIYRAELLIKIGEREYILDFQEFETRQEKEIKGIGSKEEFLEIQPYGEYIILNDIDLTGVSGNTYRFGSDNMEFNGKINFNGFSLIRDAKNSVAPIIYKMGAEGVIQNIVFDVKLNRITEFSSNDGFLIKNNYGTIQNMQLNVTESISLPNWRFKILIIDNYGTIENFVVNMQEPMYATAESGILCWRNYGVIKNGYLYGENINAEFTRSSGEGRSIGTLANSNEGNGQIKNVFSLINVDVNNQTDITNNVGNIVASNNGNASVENVYSVGLGKNITNINSGPNIYSAGGKISNNYYFNDEVFKNSYHQKTTMLALHDVNFQNQLLNGDSRFNIEENVTQGYYPQIIMPDVMPNQEYIPLPEVEDDDLADILSIEVLEQGTDTVKVKFNVYNPSGETITSIKMKDISCSIISQTYGEGRSDVIATLHSPIKYLSKYSVLSITTKGAFNIPYTREFLENERVIEVDLYREIRTVSDWKNINISPTENYILEEDLDFMNEGSEIIITKAFTGKLEGNGHTIKNIRIDSSGRGLFIEVQGVVDHLNVENLTWEEAKKNRLGLIEYLNKGKINQVHMKDVKIEVSKSYVGDVFGGAIVGYATGGSITNSSVNNFEFNSQNQATKLAVGGMIGTGSNNNIQNSYIQNVNLYIKNASEVSGIGGIYGYDSGANSISNCYVIGKIETDSSNVGGIGGFFNKGEVKSCYSNVHIITDGEYVGGIVGNDRSTLLVNISNNLAIGNVYSKQKVETVSRIVGNSKEKENNYAYERQRINGSITKETEGATLLNIDNLKDKTIYQDRIKLGTSYSYEKIEQGVLPQLYDVDRNELLPNQIDNKLPEEEKTELEIEEVEAVKTAVDTVTMRIVLKNTMNRLITKIEIEDMEVKITNNINQNEKTYLNVVATPTRYYDSYRISKVSYEESGEIKEKEVEERVNVEFYKEIYSYEDWQTIEENTYQNYRLMNDIDFKDKSNIKTDLTIGKLEGNNHKLSNINLVLNSSNSGFIKTVKTILKDVTFENINITNTASGIRTGIIANTNATVSNITLNNVIVDAPKLDQVGFIGRSTSESIENITMDTVKITGKSYVAGYAGSSVLPMLRTVEANNLTIVGNGDHVGGILSSPEKRNGYNMKYVTVQNSNITGKNNVGGIFGNLSGGATNPTQGQYLKIMNSSITGVSTVGGVAGEFFDSNSFEAYHITVKGSGSNIGGIVAKGNLSNNIIEDSIIEGISSNSNNVGGVIGAPSWGGGNNRAINCTVSSKGNNVGGIFGYYNHSGNGGSEKNYVQGGSVTGNSNVGGIVGYSIKGYIIRSYTNTKVTAISQCAGGIAGYIRNQVMETSNFGLYNCYVAGSVIEAKNNVGGIVGGFSDNLQGGYQYIRNNYIQADLIGNEANTSLGLGKQKDEVRNLKNIYVYQYSTINGENINVQNEPFIGVSQYLKEEDLKLEETYKNKIGLGTDYTYTSLQQEKYPLINGLSNQEGIKLPKDSEHIISETNTAKEISSIAEKLEEKELIEKFDYEQYEILLYEDSSKIINKETNEEVMREDRIYVKEGNLYVIDGNLEIITNNVILDRYNGKEYETVLGTDGKIYDLKEAIHYPENFKNKDIISLDNNLHTEYKITTVTYEDGSSIQFNYQTGEILKEEKLEEKQLGIIDYLKQSLERRNTLIEDTKESYEETQKLVQELQEKPIEIAIQEKNDRNTDNPENIENTQTSISSSNEKEYITSYNTKTRTFEIYNEEEILNTKQEEVISENEKIARENLNEYYTGEMKKQKELPGIVWVSLSIIGVVIILIVLWRRKNV